MDDPEPDLDALAAFLAAGIALIVDLVTAGLILRLSRESMNIRAAFLHNVADALGSVAVISLLVHFAVLFNTTWFAKFFGG